MHIILTGATGTCGAAVLKHYLEEPAVTRNTILSRRPVAQADGHAKAAVVLHQDFTQYPQTVLDQLRGAEACIWALGVSQKCVKEEEYTKITYDYPVAAATAFATLSSPFKFVFVSGEGVRAPHTHTHSPLQNGAALFARIKGRAEKHLFELSARTPSLCIFAVRPGLIDPEGEHLKPTPRTGLEVFYHTALAPIMRRCVKGHIIGTQLLAHALTGLAVGDGEPILEDVRVEVEGGTLSNTVLRRLAGI